MNRRCGLRWAIGCLLLCCCAAAGAVRAADPLALVPRIAGPWWQVAGDPDLGPLGSPKQQPVDFAVWQAADGSWQLWSCIRHTNCGGHTRLFYRWEGQQLTDADWRPMGIAMQADPQYGEQPGGLQAPHVIRWRGKYWMFYGDWQRICLAESEDGKQFRRVLDEQGQPALFRGPYPNSRDAMVLQVGEQFYCYYTGHTARDSAERLKAAVFCRTSRDLRQWSEPVIVSAGGSAAEQTDWYGGDCECPFVVHRAEHFYLFRNQRYTPRPWNTQYAASTPLDFGVDDDRFQIGTLPVAAPEIVLHEGQYYIAALLPNVKGIRIARLEWVSPGPGGQ